MVSARTPDSAAAPTLASALTLPCGQILPNRVMKAALSEALADRRLAPTARLERLYGRWADGGYGLVVTGNVMVDSRYLAEPGNVVVEDYSHLAALTRWAKTAQGGGAPVWMQINHPGRQGNPVAGAGPTVAPSAVRLDLPGLPAPRALTDTEVEETVGRYATTAAIAEEAGFSGVQVHAAHGYLISQFLSPKSNIRTDRWGGDVAGRSRFLLEIVRAVRAAVAPGFAVGVKLNSADFQRGGFTEDESREVVRLLAAEGIDLLEISGGSYESPAMVGTAAASTRAREAYFLEYAETVRAIAPTLPLAVTGGFRTRTAMSEALASGACDIIGLGRPTAINPDAAADIIEGHCEVLESASLALPVPKRLAATRSAKSVDGLMQLQWHADQLHRMADGHDPDPARPLSRTMLRSLQHNGIDAITASRRGTGATDVKPYPFALEPVDEGFFASAKYRHVHVLDLAADADTVWTALCDPTPMPWCRLFSGTYFGSIPIGTVGAQRRVSVAGLVKLDEHFFVWDDDARHFSFYATSASVPLFRAFAEDYRVEETATGSRLTWTFAYDPRPGFGLVLAAGEPVNKLVFGNLVSDTRKAFGAA